MKIFIYSLKREISQIICDHLTDKGNLCYSFITQSDLTSAIRNQKTLPDLLILDYLLFNHDIFNIYTYLEDTEIKFPTIFYNDPCLIRSSRSAHWLAMTELTQLKFEEQDFSHYKPVFDDLEELIESDELRPYIPLLQPAQELPLSLVKDDFTLRYLRENKDDCIYDFQKRTNIPNNLFYLLQLFQKNKEVELSFADIIKLYAKDGKSISQESLKVHLSKLRKYIKNDEHCTFLIVHDNERYRFIRYKA